MVDGFDVVERTILADGLRDPGDAHVVAAAVRCGASLIITDNLKDFPGEFLKPYGLQAKSADDFLADCIGLDATQALAAFNKMRLRFKRPEFSWDGLCQKAAAQGLTHTASTMREFSTLFG